MVKPKVEEYTFSTRKEQEIPEISLTSATTICVNLCYSDGVRCCAEGLCNGAKRTGVFVPLLVAPVAIITLTITSICILVHVSFTCRTHASFNAASLYEIRIKMLNNLHDFFFSGINFKV